jgi:hypothetical protein
MFWYNIGWQYYMNVIQLTTNRSSKVSEYLLIHILKRDFNAFKATSKQFIRNNKAYLCHFSGMIA